MREWTLLFLEFPGDGRGGTSIGGYFYQEAPKMGVQRGRGPLLEFLSQSCELFQLKYVFFLIPRTATTWLYFVGRTLRIFPKIRMVPSKLSMFLRMMVLTISVILSLILFH